jgi:predicted adenylyl cyclase CyaB
MKKEIEVLWELKGGKAVTLRILRSLRGFSYVGSKRTRDTYYVDPKRSPLKPNRGGRLTECLRVRQKGDKAYVTYKVDHFRGDEWTYSDEHETEVGDHAAMQRIIGMLGLEVLVDVDMEKHLFLSDDLEVAVEDVKGLGLFIEVETRATPTKAGIMKEKESIRRFLAGTGITVGKEQNAGKPELLLRARRRHSRK